MLYLTGAKGGVALVNKSDAAKVKAQGRWYLSTHGQAVISIPGTGSKKLALHRFITGAGDGQVVIPKNGNILDCRRKNLVVAAGAFRATNKKHPGVCYDSKRKMWRATIGYKNTRRDLGRFATYDEAVEARKEAESPDRYVHFDNNYKLESPNGRAYRVMVNGQWVGRFHTRDEARRARDEFLAGKLSPKPHRVTGIYFCTTTRKWRAQHNGKCLGRYSTRDEAIEAKKRWLAARD